LASDSRSLVAGTLTRIRKLGTICSQDSHPSDATSQERNSSTHPDCTDRTPRPWASLIYYSLIPPVLCPRTVPSDSRRADRAALRLARGLCGPPPPRPSPGRRLQHLIDVAAPVASSSEEESQRRILMQSGVRAQAEVQAQRKKVRAYPRLCHVLSSSANRDQLANSYKQLLE
jgi:hypothetical protein